MPGQPKAFGGKDPLDKYRVAPRPPKTGKDPLDKYRRVYQRSKDPKARRAYLAKRFGIIAAILAAVIFSAAWNPPTTGVHTFSSASDYKASNDSGCTNSGKGCHGSDKEYADFNAYHPDSECTDCHAYQGVGCIPCHTPGALHECPVCHDGTMKGAADVVRLTDPYPRGHYRETSHTAIATDLTKVMRGAAGGQARAACSACHAADLKESHTGVPVSEGSPYGPEIGCGECHNDTRVGSLRQVERKWEGRACDNCHTPDSPSPVHDTDIAAAIDGSGILRCGSTGSGCHPNNELHAMHADAPKDCSGSGTDGTRPCHDLRLQSNVPTTTACGGISNRACHRLYVNRDYSHSKDREVHSPTNYVPAGDTSFFDTPCGDCHRMDPDGTSLVDEHALPTSARSQRPGDNCRNCHNNLASASAVANDWQDRNTSQSCSTCHGTLGLAAAHLNDIGVVHATTSAGCGSTGPGCHPTSDLSEVGPPTTSANLHRDCLRCHDWRRRDGDMAYDPTRKTCGQGRACHGASGQYAPATGVHDGGAGLADGYDHGHHVAGSRQKSAVWVDPVAGTSTQCGACHSMTMATEHGRTNSSIYSGAGTLCTRCHDHDLVGASVVKSSWPARDSRSACAACHQASGAAAPHSNITTAHVGIELDPTGTRSPGACVSSGCHATLDLRRLHRFGGCTVEGCHRSSGDIRGDGLVTCGGVGTGGSCHAGFSATNHFVDHDADRSGTVDGVAYGLAANEHCFGCHFTDLTSEHGTQTIAGSMEGGGATSCAVCHYNPDDPGNGRFAGLSAVKQAIAGRDLRCVACHDSGGKSDGPGAVASAHKDTSVSSVLPAGKVWTDPLQDWRAALDSPAGGGHNALPADVVGATQSVRFPTLSYTTAGTTFDWALPPNTGPTTWLRASVFGTSTVSDPASIRGITVTCDDCHSFGGALAGPHGAAVKINIDPDYSQTAYANPNPMASQFEATGTDRVVCFKCHNLQTGSVPGTTAPGGNQVHAQHVRHSRFPPYNPNYFGEKCVDCHVRIPHAWKHARLLVRTAIATDGVTPDAFPYVRTGYDGMAGIRLRSFVSTGDLGADSCVTGGCYGPRTPTNHPMSSDIPGATYWP
jgi:hypothetical protein